MMRRNKNKLVLECLRLFNNLQIIIFTIYLKRDYVENHFQYERDLHLKNTEILQVFRKLRASTSEKETVMKLEQAYELILSISTLRFRLTDFSLLEMSQQELLQITEAITQSFEELFVTPSLLVSIQLLEKLYQNTLRVVEKEPFVLAIFIDNLFSLDIVLQKIMQPLEIP